MSVNPSTPPALDELMKAYLSRHPKAIDADDVGDMDPYEAVPAYVVDPREAWDGALEAMIYLAPAAQRPTRLPGGWSAIVATMPVATGVPMSVGSFPQAVRDILPLVQSRSLSETLRGGSTVDAATLDHFIDTCVRADEPMPWLIAAGLQRLTGRLEQAERILREKLAHVPQNLLAAWKNEQAAVAWQRGDRSTAIDLWKSLGDLAPALFNRGMAELFADRAASACPLLRAAVEKLPDSSPWHHLGRMYLALAETR